MLNALSRPMLLTGAALVLGLAACDTAAPELQDLPPGAAAEVESADMAYGATENTPSEFEDATGSAGM